MYKKILIPTDGSEPSQKAEDHGLQLAQKMDAEVTALHVTEIIYAPSPIPGPPPVLPEEQTKLLREAGEKMVNTVQEKGENMGVAVTPLIVTGHAADKIITIAQDFDLIVMGTLGKSGLAHLLLGSTAEKVTRHAPCPVLIVRVKENK
jgi:nucleotide-binding universal stress UspA family protein